MCAWWAGFARPPRTQNCFLRREVKSTNSYLWPLSEIHPIDGQISVVPRRRTGPPLGRMPTFSPRAKREFLVGAGRASPGRRPPKTIRQGEKSTGRTAVRPYRSDTAMCGHVRSPGAEPYIRPFPSLPLAQFWERGSSGNALYPPTREGVRA